MKLERIESFSSNLGWRTNVPRPRPSVEVALGCQIHECLPDWCDADAPPLRKPALRREPRAGSEAARDDLLVHQIVDLPVQGHERASVQARNGHPIIAAALLAGGLATERRCRHLLRLPTFDPPDVTCGELMFTDHYKFVDTARLVP